MHTLPLLHLDRVSYTFAGGPTVVRAVDWSLPAGEFHCLVGRSGCGKTTLLKLAAGLLLPTQGRVSLREVSLQQPVPDVGFVFQSPTLLDWLSVLDNVLLPIALQRTPTAQDHAQAQALLARMGLSQHSLQRPGQLSGGQQSRVAIARALITQPALLLMDEPFAALDAITREELQEDLLQVSRSLGTAVLFVTHDIAEAVYLGDRVAVMQAGALVCAMPVPLSKPRAAQVRHSAAFNQVCAQLRHAMGGQATQGRADSANGGLA